MPLIRLIDDLIRDKQLRRRFVTDPNEVMDEYALKRREKRILLMMDPDEVARFVPAEMRQEIRRFQIPLDEFRAPSDDFMVEGGGTEPQYPSPKPGIFRYRINPAFSYLPVQVPDPGNPGQMIWVVHRGLSLAIANALSAKAIELTVFGQSFHREHCKLELRRAATLTRPAARAAPTHFQVMGTFRSSILRGIFSPPAGEPVWVKDDEYTVVVTNNNLDVGDAVDPPETTHIAGTSLWVLA